MGHREDELVGRYYPDHKAYEALGQKAPGPIAIHMDTDAAILAATAITRAQHRRKLTAEEKVALEALVFTLFQASCKAYVEKWALATQAKVEADAIASRWNA